MISDALRSELSGHLAFALGAQPMGHQRNFEGQDAGGAPLDDWRDVGTFAGRLRQAKRIYDATRGELVQPGAEWELVLSLAEADRAGIEWGDRVVAGDVTYGIVGSDKGRTGGYSVVYQATRISNR